MMKAFTKVTPYFVTLLSVVVVVIIAGSSAQADQKKGEVTFEDVLTQAISTSPLVKEIDSAIAIRLAESIETRLRLNPELQAGVGVPVDPAGDADKTQLNLTLSQPLRPSDFGARSAVSTLLSESATTEQKLSILELSQSAYLSYAKLWVLQEQKKFLVEQRDRARRISEKVEKATSAGALGKGEGNLFRAEYQKLRAQLLGVEADSARERANLLKLSTFSLEEGLPLELPPIELVGTSTESILQSVEEGSLPIQTRYELLAKVAREREKLARKDAFPAFSPQIGYQRTEDGGSFVGVGIQFELPFSNRNQAEILRRQGEATYARAKNAYSRSDAFREEVKLSLRSMEALRQQAETYKKEVIPSLVSALGSYEAQFQAGAETVLPIWQAQRELADAQLASLDLWLRMFTARSEVSILLGKIL
ncbi:TolC family protein [Phormidium tenue]|uniref:Transporter n=1 Tax=Phormidium tenue NIES-30 TaxID=549789 RepID=A0A1U7J7U9_9CYAN|nr:TolC family protein [Phormidium tenue]MBD2231473.1 TolC family protein [Phormidium tenue FACHB-1052]OKH49137.1 hypothetical protein NIES30_08215 [Phormidium tenue NIES-30]